MVLPFQTQEVARTDVQEAKLPTVLIDVEVRHCPTTVPPESRTLFWRISCWGEAGCSCSSSLIRAMGSPFLLEPTDPCTSIITISAQRFWKGPIHPSAWRNCLEIRDRSRIGAPRAAKRGGRSPNSGASCHQRGALRRFRLFSKQFRKGNSAKFGCSKQFSEASTRRCRVLVGNSSASLAPYLLDDGRGGLYLVEHRIRSSLQDLVEVPRLYGRAKHNNRDAAIRPA